MFSSMAFAAVTSAVVRRGLGMSGAPGCASLFRARVVRAGGKFAIVILRRDFPCSLIFLESRVDKERGVR